MLAAIVGVNWGDEGKGRMVDLLSQDYDVVCRCQGGNNAGHTVVNDKGRFILNLLPSGILRDGAMNVMGTGMVIDIAHLCGEIDALEAKGVAVSPDNLKISDKAMICLPCHKLQDILEEDRLGDKKQGSTRRGIAPAYSDKYMRKGLRMGDLLDTDALAWKLSDFLAWKALTLKGYDSGGAAGADTGTAAGTAATATTDTDTDLSGIPGWVAHYGARLAPFVADTSEYLYEALGSGKDILFEAQLGALRDIDYGIYPYTTSSQTLAAYTPIGAGIPGAKLDLVIGVMKAYSSSVGGGPFVVEMFGEEAKALREAGAEYGAATGRPRRVGAFDVPASRYGARLQGVDQLALTKLDVLSYMEKIPVCVAYEIDGEQTENFPSVDKLFKAKPVFEYLEGFHTDISLCRKAEDLPGAAIRYVRYLERAVGCPIKYVSVGPGRDDYLLLQE
ncbi:MAG: adenylosuccinate synthase [Oscillospiraceae bacterium]|nr:adenylosuccinate synthase [Oscillospiraceae bacterium]